MSMQLPRDMAAGLIAAATHKRGKLAVAAGSTDLARWTPEVAARAGEIRAAAGTDKMLFIPDGEISPKAVEGLGKSGVLVRALAPGPVK